MPTKRTLADIKLNLLQPALTSHFEVTIDTSALTGQFSTFMQENGLATGSSLGSNDQTKLTLLCSEATLPGSSLATHEINNDFTGVTERHAYRRIYDDRIDFTFYVDAEKYLPIRYFEAWIKFISNETIAESSQQGSSKDGNFFYRVRFPDDYNRANIKITKFERNYIGNILEYEFIRCYPISVASMPVSYDASNLLKCTVSFTYVRYIVNPAGNGAQSAGSQSDPPPNQAYFGNTAQAQAFLNGQFGIDSTGLSPNLSGPAAINSGGIPDSVVSSSGNTVDRKVEAGLPYVGRNVGPIAPFSGI